MSDWNQRANEIFADAIGIEEDAVRGEFIAAACGDNDHLRRQVHSLLDIGKDAQAFLQRPAIEAYDLAVDNGSAVGSIIGNCKLLQEIGEGGFGIVYLAQQTRPVRRQVALKIIKPGMDTRDVVARFEAERQALALMDHPNIAKVIDGGATREGRPYFVMELVKGIPITEFCDENRLTVGQRLELFITVCKAVQHAHQKRGHPP